MMLFFSSFCDLRPFFKDPDKKEIVCFIPIIIARIRVEDDLEGRRDLVFQMDSSSFERMQESMNTIKEKFDILCKSNNKNIPIKRSM